MKESRLRWWLVAGVAAAAVMTTGIGVSIGSTQAPAGQPADGEPLKDTAYPVPQGAVFAAPDGSDTAAGTVDHPLRTVKAAVAKSGAGGTVVLRAGMYREGDIVVNKRIT